MRARALLFVLCFGFFFIKPQFRLCVRVLSWLRYYTYTV